MRTHHDLQPLDLGGTLLRVLAGLEDGELTNPCRLDIDPGSVQVWQTERAIHHTAAPAQTA